MNDKKKTIQDVPSLTNTGMRVAPFNNSSQFMELHKLDYKRQNLLDKLQRSEREIRNVKRNIARIEQEMALVMDKVKLKNARPATEPTFEPATNTNQQLLKY
ncbi:MAG: hypothetical protein AAF616_02265 [Bacteroidota bacterium]